MSKHTKCCFCGEEADETSPLQTLCGRCAIEYGRRDAERREAAVKAQDRATINQLTYEAELLEEISGAVSTNPPTPEELREWREQAALVQQVGGTWDLGRLINEVKRLRALCREAEKHPWPVSLIADAKMQNRLGTAAEGR